MRRYEKDVREYSENLGLYDATPVNFYDTDSLIRQFDDILDRENESDQSSLMVGRNSSVPLIKPLRGFKQDMEKKLKKTTYNKNVFLMMKFRITNKLIYDFINDELEAYGYNCVRADEPQWDITENVYNPIAVLYCCKYGIALFDEAEPQNEYSANVAYELGFMHDQRKKCLVLRHTSLKGPPFDLVKELYRNYTKEIELRKIIENWISTLP